MPAWTGGPVAIRCAIVSPRNLVERGIDIRTIQVLLGHESLETTMIYTHVARKGPAGVPSPLDGLDFEAADIEAAARESKRLQEMG